MTCLVVDVQAPSLALVGVAVILKLNDAWGGGGWCWLCLACPTLALVDTHDARHPCAACDVVVGEVVRERGYVQSAEMPSEGTSILSSPENRASSCLASTRLHVHTKTHTQACCCYWTTPSSFYSTWLHVLTPALSFLHPTNTEQAPSSHGLPSSPPLPHVHKL